MLPDYVVKTYAPDLHKIVRLKYGSMSCNGTEPDYIHIDGPECRKALNSEKFESAVSRARSTVFDLGIANEWSYFCTFTLSEAKYDRDNLPKFRADFAQWIRDQRKRVGDIKYILIPERHLDGAWHIHGLIYADLSAVLQPFEIGKHPKKLVDGCIKKGWRWWPAYQKKFGFCSLAPIVNHEACIRYITKYITKDLARANGESGAHLYFPSRGLNRPEKTQVYGYVPEYDVLAKTECDFAFVGEVRADIAFLLQLARTGGNQIFTNFELSNFVEIDPAAWPDGGGQSIWAAS